MGGRESDPQREWISVGQGDKVAGVKDSASDPFVLAVGGSLQPCHPCVGIAATGLWCEGNKLATRA
jgi:hypothetical protein